MGVVALKSTEMKMFPQRKHWLGSLYVSEVYRGKMIATLLEAELVLVAKAHSIFTLYLQTETLTGGLYKCLGWRGIEVVNHSEVAVLVMCKNI